VVVALASAPGLRAGGLDLTLYAGTALPRYEQTFRFGLPTLPNLPGVDVGSSGDLVLDAKGGLVFGGALAVKLIGPLALEGRLDTATVDLETAGAAYTLTTSAPLPPLEGSLHLGAGTFDLKRFKVLSLNLRLETGGPLSLFFSGGLSYLPKLESEGTITATLDLPGVNLPALAGTLQLVAVPTQEEHSVGANAGLGLRAGLGGNLSLLVEARIFGFREYELAFSLAGAPSLPILEEAIAGLERVRFDPVYFHAAAGLSLSF
jgi:hypothetical protein